MMGNIQAQYLLIVRHAEHFLGCQRVKKQSRSEQRPANEAEQAQNLHAKLTRSASMQQSPALDVAIHHSGVRFVCKQGKRNDSPGAANQMHSRGLQRVVNAMLQQELSEQVIYRAANEADDHGFRLVNERAAGRDGDQATQNPVQYGR